MSKSVLTRVLAEAGVPKEIAMAVDMAILECDLLGWKGDELGRRLLMWRDRKVKVVSEQIRRQLAPRRRPPAKPPIDQVTSALNVWTPPRAITTPPVGLPDVQSPPLPWMQDEPEQLPLPNLNSTPAK